jgi:P27 family predicted phage terminase small subunit
MNERPSRRLRIPGAPAQLGADGRRLWRAVIREYSLEAHSLEQLAIACEAADRAAEARAAIEADGPYIDGRYGQRQHPALAVERDARLRELRALRELGLDLSSSTSRPPSAWHS